MLRPPLSWLGPVAGAAAAAACVAAASAVAAPTAAPPSFSGCAHPPTVTPTVPTNANPNQPDMNCFAWQEFIALNWQADAATCTASSAPASAFGDPQSSGPVVWETFKRRDEIFQSGAKPPAGWCQMPSGKRGAPTRKTLDETSKFADDPTLDLDDFHQAVPDNAWLTSQTRVLTLYEELANQDEFAYIDENGLYNAVTQQTFAQNPGINLPDGSDGGTGSIELKAAWIELDDPAQWPLYKTSKATVLYPGTSGPQRVTVGLVGLHIIHKVANAQQFVWATFEHVGNAPSITDISSHDLDPPYLYYNPSCSPPCQPNVSPVPGQPYTTPIQVVRENPLDVGDGNDIMGLNAAVWSTISQVAPTSVFLNYELVNVLWPNASTPISPGAQTPLPAGNPQPTLQTEGVANTTMETYVQNLNCLSCHVSAPIGPKPTGALELNRVSQSRTVPTAASAPYASDYSFMFLHATNPIEHGGGAAGAIIGAAAAGIAAAAAAAVVRRRRRR